MPEQNIDIVIFMKWYFVVFIMKYMIMPSPKLPMGLVIFLMLHNKELRCATILFVLETRQIFLFK